MVTYSALMERPNTKGELCNFRIPMKDINM